MHHVFMRVSTGLKPANKAAYEALQKYKEGQYVRVEIAQVRSPEQLRKYWALITLAWQNQEAYATKEDLSSAALCAIGHCYTVKRGDVVIERAKSIAFGNLPQAEFNQIYDAVRDLLARTLGITADDLSREAAEPEPPMTDSERYLGAP